MPKMRSLFEEYQSRFRLAIETLSNFDSFRSPDWATNWDWGEWSTGDVKWMSRAFLFLEHCLSGRSWRCFYCNFSHLERHSTQRFFLSIVKMTCRHASSLSFSETLSSRNSSSVSIKIVTFLATDVNVTPGYGAARILGAASTPKILTTSPQRTQQGEGLLAKCSWSVCSAQLGEGWKNLKKDSNVSSVNSRKYHQFFSGTPDILSCSSDFKSFPSDWRDWFSAFSNRIRSNKNFFLSFVSLNFSISSARFFLVSFNCNDRLGS